MRHLLLSTLLTLFSFIAMADQYRVELAVFETRVENTYFKGIDGVKYDIDRNNFYRYYIGDFDDLATAKSMQKKAMDLGFKHAKVINFSELKASCTNTCAVPERFHHLFFDFDKHTLRPKSKRDLDFLSDYLKTNTNHKIQLSGHTDSKGNDDYNVSLSLRRVKAAKEYLLAKGIAEDRILISHHGENQPIADNNRQGRDNPEGRQYNRRVMVEIINEKGRIISDIVAPVIR